jgi:hypothetical protein
MDVLAEITGGGSAQWVFLLGLCLMIVVLLVRSRRYFRQVARHQKAMSPSAPTTHAKTIQAATPPKKVEQWEVSMHELARDLSGQLDSKIRVLEMLIREANQTAARLDAALDKARHARSAEREQTVGEVPVSIQSNRPRDPGSSTGVPRSGAPRSADPVARPARKPSSGASSADWFDKTDSPLKSTPPNPRFERIYALADAGLSPTTIANQIGSQLGEVELILSLRGTQTAE